MSILFWIIKTAKFRVIYNECGYFRNQVNDGCSSGGLSWKTDFGFFLLSLYLLIIPKKYEIRPWTLWFSNGDSIKGVNNPA
jgi:hypothetical protein